MRQGHTDVANQLHAPQGHERGRGRGRRRAEPQAVGGEGQAVHEGQLHAAPSAGERHVAGADAAPDGAVGRAQELPSGGVRVLRDNGDAPAAPDGAEPPPPPPPPPGRPAYVQPLTT